MPGSKAPKPRSPRRRWPIAEKRRIVELTLREGVSTRAIAREQGVNPTSLCHWRALYQAGKLHTQLPAAPRARARTSSATFLPVTIASALEPPRQNWGVGGRSIVQIALPSGVTVRIETDVLNARVVGALLAQLQR